MIKIEIKIKNLKINYIEQGQGKTVLILPGWGTNTNVYMGLVNYISTYANAICIDMPGFGGSEEPKESWDLNQYVDFIIEFIESKGIKELDIIGHSNGGRITIRLMNRSNLKFKVGKIILIGSAGIVHKKSLKVRFKIRTYKIGKKILGSKPVKAIFPNAIKKFQSKAGSEDYRNSSPILRQSMVKLINEDLQDELQNVSAPTLLIWGENDTATPIQDAEIMEKKIPDAGLVKCSGCSHYVFLERAGYVNTVIQAFLAN